MKNLTIICGLLLMAFLSFGFSNLDENPKQSEKIILLNSDYCDGWKDGYCEGWKDVKGRYAICPITPICPIAKLECMEGYRCGYNRGFKAGMRAAYRN